MYTILRLCKVGGWVRVCCVVRVRWLCNWYDPLPAAEWKRGSAFGLVFFHNLLRHSFVSLLSSSYFQREAENWFIIQSTWKHNNILASLCFSFSYCPSVVLPCPSLMSLPSCHTHGVFLLLFFTGCRVVDVFHRCRDFVTVVFQPSRPQHLLSRPVLAYSVPSFLVSSTSTASRLDVAHSCGHPQAAVDSRLGRHDIYCSAESYWLMAYGLAICSFSQSVIHQLLVGPITRWPTRWTRW